MEITGYLKSGDDEAPPAGTQQFREFHAVRAIQKVILEAKPLGKCRENIKVYQARNARKVKDIGFRVKDMTDVNWKAIAVMPLLRDIPIGEMDGQWLLEEHPGIHGPKKIWTWGLSDKWVLEKYGQNDPALA